MLVKYFFILPILKIKNGTAKLNCTNNKIPVILTTFLAVSTTFLKFILKIYLNILISILKTKIFYYFSNLSIITIFQLHFF